MFLGLQLFIIAALAFSGFLNRAAPLVFVFICLFIYFDNPHFTEGICSEGISGLSRQFLTLFTQDIWLVYIRDTSKNNCLEPTIHLLFTSKYLCMTLPLLSFLKS